MCKLIGSVDLNPGMGGNKVTGSCISDPAQSILDIEETVLHKWWGVDVIYCSNCGSRIPEGSSFCSLCGERSIASSFSASSDEARTNPILTFIGGAVGIIFAIVATIISFALPILFVMALIWGPSATWDRVSAWLPGVGSPASESCPGFDGWLRDAELELANWEEEISEFGAVTQMSPVEARKAISATERTIEWMEESDPPTEAQDLANEYIRMLQLTLDILAAYVDEDMTELLILRSDVVDVAESVMFERDSVITACG